ncbi:elongation factor P maturation arginine rhamnosyltransferase EarP [Thalassolituus sp. LLYu03]|uniref:elongation factor P maturation arginine rhamnosyltransferase EarP n=1 Tax=Thalassolituus sp. LLYu03 TaxID=3421656 RepID=UPI003D2DD0F8
MHRDSLNWAIFCRVIDNFGDIGVCWRLARQLMQVHGQQVTLWVDDLTSFHAIEPAVDASADRQTVDGAVVRHWHAQACDGVAAQDVADVVIEAFACDIPDPYIRAMQQRSVPPLWINLEYLSAEDWVTDFHLGHSPVHNLGKTFFFPGFTEGTGGLLFDAHLPALSQCFAAAEARQALLQAFGFQVKVAGARLISLFAYENPALPDLLEQLQALAQPVILLVPEGRISAGLHQWLGEPLVAGQQLNRGGLTLCGLPFMPQSRYDELLAACDLNFVRGEESFVRAQMLGKPMVWHIYQQEEDAHLVKLEAFLQRYLQAADEALREPLLHLFRSWNQPGLKLPDLAPLLSAPEGWQRHCADWQQSLLALGDLASNLVHYARNRV